jgi:hypothetical protein
LLAELKTAPDVLDLLITFCAAAIVGQRIEHVFPATVSARDSKTNKEWSFMTGESKDVGLLSTVIDAVPEIGHMLKYKSVTELRAALDALHPLVYPFLIWLITSNRAHLRALKSHERFKDIATDHQYVVCSSAADREQKWQAKKHAQERINGRGKGSVLFFHGSPIGRRRACSCALPCSVLCCAAAGSPDVVCGDAGNWHSILRTGMLTSGVAGTGASGASIWMANDFK